MKRAGAIEVISCAIALTIGCAHASKRNKDDEFANLGLTDASSEPPPGVLATVAEGDLPATAERGRLLARMERALVLAYEDGITRAGGAPSDVVLPLVDIDPGGKSAQVLFVRWPAADAKSLDPARAQRWLLVPLLLGDDPSGDRVLDVELLSGPIEPTSHVERRVQTLLAAAESLAATAPGEMFHLLDLYERGDAVSAASPVLGHVYALSADGDGTDLELVVEAPKKRKSPKVQSVRQVHARGGAAAPPITIATAQPHAITVARAMLLPPDADPSTGDASRVLVQTEAGARWTVSVRTGQIATDASP